MLKITICDDEENCRRQLCTVLREYTEKQGIEAEIKVFESADRLLVDYPKDTELLFLDIAMPGVDGMAAARHIRSFDTNVCIIFITTMYRYAIEGYGVRAFGFIKKPVNRAELEHELGCAINQIESNRLREQFLSIRIDGNFHRIPISRISYFEVKNHQIELMVDGKLYSYRNSMNELEKDLGELGFFRCHSSYLVNGEHISRIEQTSILLKNGTVIPISQRRRREFEAYESSVNTGNGLVDALLSEKIRRARLDKVDFNICVDLTPLEHIHSVDMVTIFGNTVDNAIEAVSELEDESERINRRSMPTCSCCAFPTAMSEIAYRKTESSEPAKRTRVFTA